MVPMFTTGSAFTEKAGSLAMRARDWLNDVIGALNQAPLRKQIVSASGQTAAIAATAIPLGVIVPGGYYRVSVYLRLTRAATTSSSVTPTIGWTNGGQARTKSGAAYTGNVLTGCADPFSIVLQIDASTALTYAVAYASVGATTARYDVDVIVEKIPEMPA